jgi:N-carbamoylputrescine amidase
MVSDASFLACLLQQRMTEHKQDNIKTTAMLIKKAAAQGAQLVLLPELHATRYFCQTANSQSLALAEPIPGPTSTQLSSWAKHYHMVIVGSVYEKRGHGLYHNTAVVYDRDGSLAGIYRKMHIPDDPGYHEKYYFSPGDTGFVPIKTSLATLGVLVCWDQWFPEAARAMALAGAQLLLYPTAIGFDPRDTIEEQQRQCEAWVTVQRGHAIANSLPVLTCNRAGFEPHPVDPQSGNDFWGHSFITGAQGQILTQLKQEHNALLFATIDLKQAHEVQKQWPFFRDRRTDAYGPILNKWSDNTC